MESKDNEVNEDMYEEFSFDFTEEDMEVRRAQENGRGEHAARIQHSSLIGRAFGSNVLPTSLISS